jgi:hypothetical protein
LGKLGAGKGHAIANRSKSGFAKGISPVTQTARDGESQMANAVCLGQPRAVRGFQGGSNPGYETPSGIPIEGINWESPISDTTLERNIEANKVVNATKESPNSAIFRGLNLVLIDELIWGRISPIGYKPSP